MDAAEVNGGNAEVVSNLENISNSKSTESPTDSNDKIPPMKEIENDLNGEVKVTPKKVTLGKRKMRKSKANSTSTIESGTKPRTRGPKRKLSERDDISSEESSEFNGFDAQGPDSEETGSHVLKKLIGNYKTVIV